MARLPFTRVQQGIHIVEVPDRELGNFTGLRRAAERGELEETHDIFQVAENNVSSGGHPFGYSVLRIWKDLNFYGATDREVELFLKEAIDVIMYG